MSSVVFVRVFIACGNKMLFGLLIFLFDTAYIMSCPNDYLSLKHFEPVSLQSVFPDNIVFDSCPKHGDNKNRPTSRSDGQGGHGIVSFSDFISSRLILLLEK